MKSRIKKQFAFFGRSMLWSLMLYVIMMLAINWDEISNSIHGKNSITVVTTIQQNTPDVLTPSVLQPDISTQPTIVKSIIAVLKTISGITSHSHGE